MLLMKYLAIFTAVFSFVLVGCTSEESAPVEAPAQQSEPQPAADEPAATEPEDASDADEEQPPR